MIILGAVILEMGASIMKSKVIWVDFSAKKKGKSKMRKFLEDILHSIKQKFSTSNKHNKPKPLDNHHKSIL
jgi:hypothetical protein